MVEFEREWDVNHAKHMTVKQYFVEVHGERATYALLV